MAEGSVLMSRYEVEATQVGRSWHVEVAAIGRSTQARRRDEVEEVARDLIEIMTGESDAMVEVCFSALDGD